MLPPEKLGVIGLFTNPRRYVVPLYQRKYVWNQEKQWEPLVRDILSRADAVLESNAPVATQHFLGAIVIEPIKVGMRQMQAYNVIDGQQRLTTLQVLVAALRNLVASIDPAIHEELVRATKNSGLMTDEIERYKVWPTNFDRESFSQVLDSASHEDVERVAMVADESWVPRPRLVEGYLYFHKELSAWLYSDVNSLPNRIEALFHALREAVQIVVITLDESDDAQVIFETLNARGAPLLPSDLIRNFVFLQANQQGLNSDSLYRRYWQRFDEEGANADGFWSAEAGIGRERHARLVWFLLHFLSSKLARELSIGRVYDAFQEWWKTVDGPNGVEEGLRELEQQSKLYRSLLEPDPSSRLGVFAERLNTLDYRTAYPLLLHILSTFGTSSQETIRILDHLESFLVRRFVCRLPTRSYSNVFTQLLQRLKAEHETKSGAAAVYGFLAENQSDFRRWPNDEELRRAWMQLPAYRLLRRSGTEMILKAVESLLTSDYQEKVTIHQKLTVEHVLPQSWSNTWPTPDPDLAGPDETAEDVRNRLLHTFGNLTLLTRPLNTKNSNLPYDQKRPLITEQSRLRLNAYFQKQEYWDEQAVSVRGDALLNIARRNWSAPQLLGGAKTARTSPSPNETSPKLAIDPLERLQQALKVLETSLPDSFELTTRGQRVVQARPTSWPQELHYELRAEPDAMVLGVHCEYVRRHPNHPEINSRFAQIEGTIEKAFPEGELMTGGNVWTMFDLRYPLGTHIELLVDELRKLVVATQDEIEQRLSLGKETSLAA